MKLIIDIISYFVLFFNYAVVPMPLDLKEIKPQAVAPAYSDVVTNGPNITPQQYIQLYSADQWESFVEEYADGLKSKYSSVLRIGGAGDKGVDVAAFKTTEAFKGNWDNYQCKHYDHALHPGDVILEMGKLCYYTFIKEYPVPDNYFIVGPQGVGTSLAKMLRGNHAELKKIVIDKWAEKIAAHITKTVDSIPLEGDLANYVNAFDFSIVKDITVLNLLEIHRTTSYYHHRFGGGLPSRPAANTPPAQIAAIEVVYIQKLMNAYAEFLKISDCKITDVDGNDTLKKHLQKARVQFYSAESLHQFSRDYLQTGEYERLQDYIYEGVENIIVAEHANGFERVKAAVQEAYKIQIDSHPLKERLNPLDRAGICHQLANNDRINWTK
ncbi:MAG: hypothetical protein JST90_17225 [Bacteroidetes bacterium]|nr:hypothetical protein [Bacteroidota bacterium]